MCVVTRLLIHILARVESPQRATKLVLVFWFSTCNDQSYRKLLATVNVNAFVFLLPYVFVYKCKLWLLSRDRIFTRILYSEKRVLSLCGGRKSSPRLHLRVVFSGPSGTMTPIFLVFIFFFILNVIMQMSECHLAGIY